MRVFVSWSGELSKGLAMVLRDWFHHVIQSATLWVSTEDIAKGARWNDEIARELDSCSFGIVCVTVENMESPWLNFEGGALAKSVAGSLEQARVTPFLLGVQPTLLRGPLSHFQATRFEKEDVFRLVRDVNSSSEAMLNDRVVQETFDVWWPRLEQDVHALMARWPHLTETPAASESTDGAEVLEDIFRAVRSHERTLLRIEQEIRDRKSDSPFAVSVADLVEEFGDLLLSTQDVQAVEVFPVGNRWNVELDNLPSAGAMRLFETWALRRKLSVLVRSKSSEAPVQLGVIRTN